MQHKPRIAFFGTPDRAVWALDKMKAGGFSPDLIVTQPDRPQGRKLVLTPPPAKEWALKEGIPVIQPEKLDADFIASLKKGDFDAFVVIAYGKILKKEVLDIPKRGALNINGSLLPKLRGSSPIETAILNDDKDAAGASVILMDELMDHGPIVGERKASVPRWPLPAPELAKAVVDAGADLLVEILPDFLAGKAKFREQDHSKATVAKKIVKADGELRLSDDGYQNFLKWNAYKEWPTSFIFVEKDGKKMRAIITDAAYEGGAFVPKKAIPEGKKEMRWSDFQRSYM